MKRKGLRGKEKIGVVMSEYKRGTLHSGSGRVVKGRKQAIAIAMSEAGMSKGGKKKYMTGSGVLMGHMAVMKKVGAMN